MDICSIVLFVCASTCTETAAGTGAIFRPSEYDEKGFVICAYFEVHSIEIQLSTRPPNSQSCPLEMGVPYSVFCWHDILVCSFHRLAPFPGSLQLPPVKRRLSDKFLTLFEYAIPFTRVSRSFVISWNDLASFVSQSHFTSLVVRPNNGLDIVAKLGMNVEQNCTESRKLLTSFGFRGAVASTIALTYSLETFSPFPESQTFLPRTHRSSWNLYVPGQTLIICQTMN